MASLNIVGLSRLDVIEIEKELGFKLDRATSSTTEGTSFNDIAPLKMILEELTPVIVPVLIAWLLRKVKDDRIEVDLETIESDGSSKTFRLRGTTTLSGGDSAALQEYFRQHTGSK